MAAALSVVAGRGAPGQYNFLTGQWEAPPQQLTLGFGDLELVPDLSLPESGEAVLLATESGSQLHVSGFGLSIGKKSERVTIRKNRKACGELPFFRVQEIVLSGNGISISTDLIEEACKRGIRIAILSLGGKPVALMTSPYLTATVETRRAQLEAGSNQVGAALVRWIVAGKLRNQEKLLRYFAKSRTGDTAAVLVEAAGKLKVLRQRAPDLRGAAPADLRAEAMGLEGSAGRMYWQALGRLLPRELEFRARVPEQPKDPVNSCLNYGYGILYTHVWGAVMNAGLEPFAGLLHVDRPGKPSLVLDLTEEFRAPVVERALFAWLLRGGAPELDGALLGARSREEVAARVLARLNAVEAHRGKSHQVRSIVQMQARLLASAVRGLAEYRPFTFRW